MLNHLRAVAVLFLLLPSALVAQDYNFGLRAFNAGDYAVALQEWSPLAEQGNTSAQNNLGVMHEQGRRVLSHT